MVKTRPAVTGVDLIRNPLPPRKAGYIYPQQAFRLHEKMPQKSTGRLPHAIAERPDPHSPSTHPKLGVKSKHKELHRYAL